MFCRCSGSEKSRLTRIQQNDEFEQNENEYIGGQMLNNWRRRAVSKTSG